MSEVKEDIDHDENAYVADGPKKSSGNCCLLGCLGAFLFMILVVVGGGLTTYWWVTGQVNKYTADAPADLPVVELPAEELEEIEQRIEAFKDTVEAGDTPEELVLTAKEINALIAKDEDMRGRVYVRIEDDLVTGDVSIPTDAIPGGKGRFFNASATFDVSLENGVLIVTLADAEVKGQKLPAQFTEAMSKENLAKEAYKDPDVAETLRGFDSITIEDDKIILKPRVKKETSEVPDAPDGQTETMSIEGDTSPMTRENASPEKSSDAEIPGPDATNAVAD